MLATMARRTGTLRLGFGLSAMLGLAVGCFDPSLPTVSCGEANPSCPPRHFCDFGAGECRREIGGAETDAGGDASSDGSSNPALSDDGLVVRYFIDEAGTGQGPNELVDAANDPQNLSLSYGDNMDLSFSVDNGGNKVLRWERLGLSGGANTDISTGKVRDALTMATTVTIEAVIQFSRADGGPGSPILLLGNSIGNGTLALRAEATRRLRVYFNIKAVGRYELDQGDERVVVHAVIDTSEADNSRLVVYANGVAQANMSNEEPFSMEFLQLSPVGQQLLIGNRAPPADNSSIDGAIGYVALYSKALDAETVGRHAARLLASDDNDPN